MKYCFKWVKNTACNIFLILYLKNLTLSVQSDVYFACENIASVSEFALLIKTFY